MSENRCDKHGTFSGNVGCPFCRDEQASAGSGQSDPQKRAAHGVQVVGGGGVEGVQTLSVREPDKIRAVEGRGVEIVSPREGDNAG